MNITLSQASRGLSAFALLAALAACGGGGPNAATTTSTTTTSSTGTATPVYALGSGSGATGFKTGVLNIGTTTLAAGGSTNVSVNLVDTANGNVLVTTPVENITFNSTCVQSEPTPLASFTPVTASTAPAGTANTTYTAKGCEGNDNITATAVINGTTITATGAVTVEAPVAVPEMGNGTGTAFVNQALSIQLGSTAGSPLSAGGTTSITANIVDADNGNALYTAQPVTVTFSSPCESAGLATITSPVVSSTGTISTTYTATGCSNGLGTTDSDLVTATATVGSSTLTATATVFVSPPTIGSISLLTGSSTPNPSNSVIDLQGTGGNTTSTVTFVVKDTDGNPVPNATVNFSLSTTAGGISLTPTSGLTSKNTSTLGQVSTIVTSGTVHTTVNVIATVTLSGGGTLSSELPNAIVISTGLPVQTAFSLAIVTHNVEAWAIDGQTDSVTVHLADRYGNHVNDGTLVAFRTNGGSIDGSCATTTGTCSVTWVSQDPRPATDSLDVVGHAHILAYAVGEEHYTDVNNDNVFDTGDAFSACCSGNGDSFFGQPGQDDIGDPYMDSAETGAYVSGEAFADIDNGVSVTRRAPNDEWYGAGCGGFGSNTTSVTTTTGSVTCANSLTEIGLDDCIVMSTSYATISAPSTNTITGSSGGSVTYTISDLNGNVMAEGTTVTLETVVAANNDSVTLQAGDGTTFSYPDIGCDGSVPFGATPATSGVKTFTVSVSKNSTITPPSVGQYFLQVTSPSGAVTQSAAFNIN